jgi:hypothetical protein
MGKSRKYPLELILRAHGPAELVDADENVLWVSDVDDEFKEHFPDEFLNEEDSDAILDYLYDMDIINQKEFDAFNSDRWDTTIETVDTGKEEAEENEDLDDEEEFDDDDEEENEED